MNRFAVLLTFCLILLAAAPVRAQQKGLPGTSSFIALSPEGERLATVSFSIVETWTLENQQQTHSFMAGPKQVTAMNWLLDGNRLALAFIDGSISLWSLEGKKLQELTAPGTPFPYVTGLRAVPDSQLLLGYDTRTVYLWDLASGKLTRRWEGVNVFRCGAVPSRDGRLIAFPDGQKIELWTVAGKKVSEIEAGGFSDSIDFSPDGKQLVVSAYPHGVRIYDVSSGQVIQNVPGVGPASGAVAFSPDGSLLATSESDSHNPSTVRLWDPKTGNQIRKIEVHSLAVSQLIFVQGLGLVIVHGGDGHNWVFRYRTIPPKPKVDTT